MKKLLLITTKRVLHNDLDLDKYIQDLEIRGVFTPQVRKTLELALKNNKSFMVVGVGVETKYEVAEVEDDIRTQG